MDNVFERFSINTGDMSVDTVLKMHAAYHEILAALSKERSDDSDLNQRRNKIKSEWLANTDLSPELHTVIDETEHLLMDEAFTNNIQLLAPAYTRILALASELKRHLDDQINRVANPGGRRDIIGTKAECKKLREIAQSIANIYGTMQMMDDNLPDVPALDWAKIPPGRDVELSTTPYLSGIMKYSIPNHPDIYDDWVTKVDFLDALSRLTGKRWTRHEFDTYLEDNDLSMRGDWEHTIDNVTFHQKRFTE